MRDRRLGPLLLIAALAVSAAAFMMLSLPNYRAHLHHDVTEVPVGGEATLATLTVRVTGNEVTRHVDGGQPLPDGLTAVLVDAVVTRVPGDDVLCRAQLALGDARWSESHDMIDQLGWEGWNSTLALHPACSPLDETEETFDVRWVFIVPEAAAREAHYPAVEISQEYVPPELLRFELEPLSSS